jgi:hypothetical protein
VANTLTEVVPQLLAQSLPALRANSIMPRNVNRQYDSMAVQRGSTIDVPVSAAITTQDVAPGATPPATSDIAPTSVPIALDQWKEAPFYLTDKEQAEVMEGTIPMQAQEAIKSIANTIDAFILGFYVDFYGYVGTAGVTPFATAESMADAISCRTTLNRQLAPLTDRKMILDPAAEGNALNQRALQDAAWRGQNNVIQAGQIGNAIGMEWYMDQNVLTHTSVALSAGAATVNGVHAVGVKSLSIAKATNASNLAKGDIITIAGDTQTYVVTTAVTLAVGNTAVAIEPGLRTAKAGAEVVSLKASHVANLCIHPQAIAFATRPMANAAEARQLGAVVETVVDPISGLAITLIVKYEHYRTRWAFSCLYGGKTVRRELGVRLAG